MPSWRPDLDPQDLAGRDQPAQVGVQRGTGGTRRIGQHRGREQRVDVAVDDRLGLADRLTDRGLLEMIRDVVRDEDRGDHDQDAGHREHEGSQARPPSRSERRTHHGSPSTVSGARTPHKEPFGSSTGTSAGPRHQSVRAARVRAGPGAGIGALCALSPLGVHIATAKPQAPRAMPPTAMTMQATTPTGSHAPIIGWPRWAVRASWWTQSGSLSAGARRSMR